MSRTYRRIKHSWNCIYNSRFYSCCFDDFLIRDKLEIIKYFRDSPKYSNRLLSTVSRKCMRSESRYKINNEFRKFLRSGDWNNYCTVKYDSYSSWWWYY